MVCLLSIQCHITGSQRQRKKTIGFDALLHGTFDIKFDIKSCFTLDKHVFFKTLKHLFFVYLVSGFAAIGSDAELQVIRVKLMAPFSLICSKNTEKHPRLRLPLCIQSNSFICQYIQLHKL